MSSLVCYSADLNKIFKTQIKSSNQLEFNQFNIQSFESGTSSLVWASVDRFVFKSTSNNLQVVKKNQDESLSLLNSIQLVESFDIISKMPTDYDDFNLVYAKYKENKDLNFNVLNLKNEQKAELVVNVPSSQKKDPKSIIKVKET